MQANKFSPSLCLTHDCNLNCIYCYQQHDSDSRMTFDTAKKCVDFIFQNPPEGTTKIEIAFIGGEPLLEFNLIKNIIEYLCDNYRERKYVCFATTNGTVLDEETKKYLKAHRDCFRLSLSLDGMSATHNYNRCNSFNKIDFGFFLETYPEESVKMTLTEKSLEHLADNIKFIHSLGFKKISGANLFEGSFDWSNDKYLRVLSEELKKLVEFYVENEDCECQMLNKPLFILENKEKTDRKWCGIGTGTLFFDVDGESYPCSFVTPMTFSNEDISQMSKTNFSNADAFIDRYCTDNCYISSICPTCAASNYMHRQSFSERDKSRCRIQKMIVLSVADMIAKKIIKNPNLYEETTLFYTITAIEKVKNLYHDELAEFL